MRRYYSIFIFILLCIHTVYPGQSTISKMYCLIFGNTDAHSEYQNQAHEALVAFDIEQPENVAVKQMNGIGPAFARLDLSSFTAFGIWLNEAHLDACGKNEQIFHVYHEAAHYAKKHHQKMIAGSAVFLAGMVAGLLAINKSINVTNSFLKSTAILGSGMLITLGSCLYLLPQIVKQQEKEADMFAAATLIRAGSQYIVEAHIKNLRATPYSNESALWWHSDSKQATYLEKMLK